MNITEKIKNFLNPPHEVIDTKDSSLVNPENIVKDLTNDEFMTSGVFFDTSSGLSSINNHSLYNNTSILQEILTKQKEKIMTYRKLARNADVDDALEEIINEIIFSEDGDIPVKLDSSLESEKLNEKIQEAFKKITKLLNLDKNLFFLVKNSYIDGNLILHLAYEDKTTKNGIKSIKIVDPIMFYFDHSTKTYKYLKELKQDYNSIMPYSYSSIFNDQEYSIEEIVQEDFGLKEGPINLSYLDRAIRSANQLKTLEDLLIPMRFSRSISRRVFNVDIGDLPSKRGAEVMQEHQNKFKYKKFYNAETGEISNQQHITSMVEDYWFANRSGGKGTTVDVLDETGNLGEINDILYFNKKLYKSMKVPLSRLSLNPDADTEYDYSSTRVTKDDMKFFQFTSRLRQVYVNAFKEILKREVISTGILKESEWNEYEESIKVYFSTDNSFMEKMKLENFVKKLDIYGTAQEHAGKLFSISRVLREVFNMSEEEIDETFKEIQKEKKDPKFAEFYKVEDFE